MPSTDRRRMPSWRLPNRLCCNRLTYFTAPITGGSRDGCGASWETPATLPMLPRTPSCGCCRAGSYRMPGSLAHFLSTIARGLVIDRWRRRELELAWLETLAHLSASDAPPPESRLQFLETLIAIDRLLCGIKPRAQQGVFAGAARRTHVRADCRAAGHYPGQQSSVTSPWPCAGAISRVSVPDRRQADRGCRPWKPIRRFPAIFPLVSLKRRSTGRSGWISTRQPLKRPKPSRRG